MVENFENYPVLSQILSQFKFSSYFNNFFNFTNPAVEYGLELLI